jgi:23S rRNA (uracil1939-C5)-methyltransferase
VQLDQSTSPWQRDPNSAPDQLELFTSADESRLQFTLTLRTAARSVPAKLSADFNALCESLRTHVPELTGASIAILPQLSGPRSRRNEQPRSGPVWGKPGLNYRVADVDYWVPRAAFFQVNRFLIPDLLSLVTANRTGRLAFDLYAGVGLFSRVLAASFAHVTATEIAEPAATALAATKLGNLNAIKATTLDFLHAAAVGRDRPDLIILDPPRTGAGSQVCALLVRINAPTLVYVSCSPQTLAADLTTLVASDYRLSALHLFDLFPQTCTSKPLPSSLAQPRS